MNIKKFLKKIKTLNNINKLPIDIKKEINNDVRNLFPNLITSQVEMLTSLAIYFTNAIKQRFLTSTNPNSDQEQKVIFKQLTMNNSRDIKAIILMLLPFIDDKENNKKLKMIKDLNQIIFNVQGAKYVSDSILEKEIDITLKKEFLISNFGIGLLHKDYKENGSILELKDENNTIIDEIMYHNFLGLLETLKMINGKLYINWINIVPITEDEFESEPIFKNTINDLSNINTTDNDKLISHELTYNGLWIGDFYNVFRNGYYKNVKKVKLFIFHINSKYYIQYLEHYLNLKDHLEDKYKKYIDLPLNDQYKFKIKFETLLSNIYSNDIKRDILKDLFIFLANNYSYKTELFDKHRNIFEKFKLSSDDEEEKFEFTEEDDEKFESTIEDEDIKQIYYSIGISHVWDYLKEAIDMFRGTIYSTFLIKDDNTIDMEFYYIKKNDQLINLKNNDQLINLKNIYNIGKTLSHDSSNGNWNLLSENYVGLLEDKKTHFIKKFFDNSMNWLNIDKNLKKETNNGDIKMRKIEINTGWQKLKYYFVFNYLIKKGLLSKFVPDFKISDKKSLPSGYISKNKRLEQLLEKKFKKNKKWKNCYYFLTDQKYSKLKKIRLSDPNVKIKEYEYFDLIAKKQKWYSFYAMDWLTQINFFHTYIYHQVIYVTGATGQGKSTQVPKLLLYALKMIDYKDNGRIVCTQPRIAPTVNNATRISDELGVPIEQPSYTSNEKIRTDNFYCQYKYQLDSHVNSNSNHLSLKVVTDGSLYVEIKKNIIMKETEKVKDKTNKMYTSNNMYDIIIVDEAHEHNKNMDLILTLARSSCYYNNSLKLVIISATMDDDEPIYRSYFKNINEQIMYPIKRTVLDPFLNKQVLPLSIYMDRRYHISPPGETTQYVISENYLDLPENGNPTENSIKAQERAYDVVIDICKRSSKGEVLLFSTGQREIIEAVEYLNKNMPAGNIALPYFSAMNKKYKSIIENIEKNIMKIKNHRENVYKEWGSEFIEDTSVPNDIYKRSIIVATNVAEASITINGLEYVVDNGYSKESNFGKLEVEKISEASRLQRKGRVGRLGDGVVYYMYKKGARSTVKPKYNINQQEMNDIFSDLSTQKPRNKREELYSIYYDPHLYKIFLQQHIKNIFYKGGDRERWKQLFLEDYKIIMNDTPENISKIIKNSSFERSGVQGKLVEIQFRIFKDYMISQNTTDDDINKIDPSLVKEAKIYFPFPYYLEISDQRKQYLSVYEDGYLLETLFDINGQFYLIHPYENKIVRNCKGDIIKYKFNEHDEAKRLDSLDKKVFKKIIIKSEIKLQLVNFQERKTKGSDISSSFKKTLLSEKISELRNKLTDNSLKEEDVMTLLYGYGNGVLDEIFLILALIKICNSSLKTLATYSLSKRGGYIYDFDNLKKIFPSEKSDIESIYKITQKIKGYFPDMKIFNLDKNNGIKTDAKYYYNDLVYKFKNAIKKDKNRLDPPKSLATEWDILNKIRNEGKLDDNSGFMKWLDKSNFMKKKKKKDIDHNTVKLKQFCKSNYLDYDHIRSFMEKSLDYHIIMKTIDKNEDMKIKDKNPFEWFDMFKNNFKTLYGDMSIIDKIIQSFTFGYSINTAIKFGPTYDYNIISEINREQRRIQPLFPGSENYETFLTKINNVVIYFEDDTRFNTIKIITNTTPKNLINAHPLYFNKTFFKNIIITKDEETNLSKIFEFNGPYLDRFLDEIKKNSMASKIVFQAYDNENNENNDDNLNKYIDHMRKKLI